MEDILMSKNKILILSALVLILTMACGLGGLTEGLVEKAIEKADLPEGALETAQAGLGTAAFDVNIPVGNGFDGIGIVFGTRRHIRNLVGIRRP